MSLGVFSPHFSTGGEEERKTVRHLEETQNDQR